MKKGLRMAAVSFFLFAALLSTGCGQNALMNPVIDTAQSGTLVAHSGTQDPKPGSQDPKPAGQTSKP
ncbi:MAG TPA: hypothetical protein VJQ53_07045 [Candidatus Eisenbacteria bacterium]|nr:hypothetical protein [Candidatus Eisenbacteria bacterium]